MMSEAPVSSTYTFVCDPDECDTMFQVTTSDGFGFPSGITQLKCPCGRDTTYVSFIDSTSKDVHRDSQPTERSNTMETAYEGPVVTQDQQQIVYLEEQKVALEKRIEALTVDLATWQSIGEEHRRKVKKLFTKVNDYIDENDCEEDGDINLSELDDILNDVYNNRLVFDKLYEVQITYTLDATFEIRAKNEDEAREIADEIGISTDPVFDHEDDPTECAINESRVGYLQRKVN
jgi:uncharacterized coiled-coil protein SlyX